MTTSRHTTKAVHCLGNGKACSYANGVDLFQLVGPHYSAPNAARLLFADKDGVTMQSDREEHTAIWTHTLEKDGSPLGTITEFADADLPLILRKVDFVKPVRFQLEADQVERFFLTPYPAFPVKNFYYGEIPDGASFYTYSIAHDIWRGFITDKTLYFGAVFSGDAVIERIDEKTLSVELSQGVISLFFAENFETLAGYAKLDPADFDNRMETARAKWCALSARTKANRQVEDPEIERMCDDTYVLMKTQQSVSGGVLAGYPYRLVYVRDNYAVCRSLLTLGALDEARALLEFYIRVFTKYGAIHNAQGSDAYAFHIHEIDATEITGYMMLMYLDYYDRTGDAEFLKEATPLLEWCAAEQHKILRNGMLPFNGDETYIAGFILPREVINHGSMEATALYHAACLRLLAIADLIGVNPAAAADMQSDIREIESTFAKNFYIDGEIACNNREYYGDHQPPFRWGIRLCGHGLGIGVLDKSGRYVCFDCYDAPAQENKEYDQTYFLESPVLMTAYINSPLIDKDLLNKKIDEIADQLVKNDFVYKPDKIVGYDIGLLLIVFRERHPELLGKLRKMVLDMRDEYGTWSEYYVDNLPNGTMYRTWESGINCEALILTEKL